MKTVSSVAVTLSPAEVVVFERALREPRIAEAFDGDLKALLLAASMISAYEVPPSLNHVSVPEGTEARTFVFSALEFERLSGFVGVIALDSADMFVRGCGFSFLRELQFAF